MVLWHFPICCQYIETSAQGVKEKMPFHRMVSIRTYCKYSIQSHTQQREKQRHNNEKMTREQMFKHHSAGSGEKRACRV